VCYIRRLVYDILLQGFNWESPKRYPWWTYLQSKVEELVELGVTDLWLPPACQSVDKNGNTFNCFFICLKNFASKKKSTDLEIRNFPLTADFVSI
jgi:hypothetical protein